jgi:hypothetical protein
MDICGVWWFSGTRGAFWTVTVDTGAPAPGAGNGTGRFGNLTREQLIELWKRRSRGR